MKQGQHIRHMGSTGTISGIRADGAVRITWQRPDPTRRERQRVWYDPETAAQLLREDT